MRWMPVALLLALCVGGPDFGSSGGSGAPKFAVLSVANDTHVREPVVAVLPNGTIWYAGTVNGSSPEPGHLWWGGVSGFTRGLHPTNGSGGGDATVYLSSDGYLYWAVLANVSGVKTLNVTRRLPTDNEWPEWPGSGPSFSGYDRPWFASRGNKTYLVSTTGSSSGFNDVELWLNDSTGWSKLSNVTTLNQRVGGLPQVLPDGRIVVPLMDDPNSTIASAVSDLSGTSWTSENVPMAGSDFDAHVMSAIDSNGNVFIAWESSNNVSLSVRNYSSGLWHGPHAIALGAHSTFAAAVVANGTAEVALAWYEQTTALSDWSLRYRQLSFPDGVDESPLLEDSVVVQASIGGSNMVPEAGAFGDFLQMTLAEDGSSVIAFGCRHPRTPLLELPCESDNQTLPRVAVQAAGRKI